ncbi:hypothetical protein JTE90_023133, partial [Oedothorax gibbosus]
ITPQSTFTSPTSINPPIDSRGRFQRTSNVAVLDVRVTTSVRPFDVCICMSEST